MSRLVAFLTDYGYADTYVAQVKAVLLGLCPTCEILDLTHGVPPQNVRSGAYLLASATPYLSDGAIVVAVVDPGVGTARRAVAVQGLRHTYLAPDNGLLCLALRDDPPQHAVALDNPRYHLPEVSATFHGRDVFAPCAAHLANGVPITRLGTTIDPATLQRLPDIEPVFEGDTARCRPLHTDHFGNVAFTLRREAFVAWAGDVSAPVRVQLACADGRVLELPLARAFGEVGWGEPLAYWGSNGYLEVAINGGAAAQTLGITDEATLMVVRV